MKLSKISFRIPWNRACTCMRRSCIIPQPFLYNLPISFRAFILLRYSAPPCLLTTYGNFEQLLQVSRMTSRMRTTAAWLTLVTSVQAQEWLWVAPTDNSLLRSSPPASFARSENIISPIGVSDSLDVEPALLETNKFYSNFLVRRTGVRTC